MNPWDYKTQGDRLRRNILGILNIINPKLLNKTVCFGLNSEDLGDFTDKIFRRYSYISMMPSPEFDSVIKEILTAI